MEPVTVITTALALGAAAGLNAAATEAAKDAYSALKNIIKSKYSDIDLDLLEKDPGSKKRQAVVEEELVNAGADTDENVARACQGVNGPLSRMRHRRLPA